MNYIVIACIVDANNHFTILDGFPKIYSGDNAIKNARATMYETASAMCKANTRKMQTVMIISDSGMIIDSICFN